MLFAAVGTAVLGMFGAASITLTLETQKRQILVGEPAKLISTWSSQSQQHVPLDAAWLWIDDGTGYQRHQESSIGVENGISVGLISPGEPLKLTHLIAVSGQVASNGRRDFRFAWPTPGTYRVKLQFRDVESNAVVLGVSAPQGSNASRRWASSWIGTGEGRISTGHSSSTGSGRSKRRPGRLAPRAGLHGARVRWTPTSAES